MNKNAPTPVHTWLVMMKAWQAMARYALANLEQSGLGVSDFAVLEVLLHKGPLPVNVIGPKVNLTPGSISVAIDRLVAKGLVSRAETSQDLHPGPQRGRSLVVVATAPRDDHAGGLRTRSQLRRESRLADASLAPDEDDPARAGESFVERVAQPAQRRLATDEGARSSRRRC